MPRCGLCQKEIKNNLKDRLMVCHQCILDQSALASIGRDVLNAYYHGDLTIAWLEDMIKKSVEFEAEFKNGLKRMGIL